MDQFEKQFGNIDVGVNLTNDALNSVTQMSYPENEVDLIIEEVADEAGIEINRALPNSDSSMITNSVAFGLSQASHEQDLLLKRLAKLKQN